MITHLNKQQLAFILDIKAEDARAKMCTAHCKSIGVVNNAYRDLKNKIIDDYPLAISVDVIAKELNIPTLQDSVNDIHDNYLSRAATRKYLLCDLPDKQRAKNELTGKNSPAKIPAGLRMLLSEDTIKEVKKEWKKRYSKLAS